MNRRNFLKCIGSVAPAIILTPGLLMRVRDRTPLVIANKDGIDRPLIWMTGNPATTTTASEIERLWLARAEQLMTAALPAMNTMLALPERKWFTLEVTR